MEKENNECCPRFNPDLWDGMTFDWENKRFVKSKVLTFMYMPLNFGGVMTKMVKKIDDSGAKMMDGLCLSDHASKWKMDLYLAVDKEVPGVENVTLSGKYISKVYEGPFKDTGKWCSDFDDYVKSQNLSVAKMYMWYTTCPKCAKKYGKNYTVIIAQIS